MSSNPITANITARTIFLFLYDKKANSPATIPLHSKNNKMTLKVILCVFR